MIVQIQWNFIMFRNKAGMSFRIKQRFSSHQQVKIESVFEATLSKSPVTKYRNKFDSFFFIQCTKEEEKRQTI